MRRLPDVVGMLCSCRLYTKQTQTALNSRAVFVSQLNGSTVGDVHIKVSIARKQPMLDAATGKSVWASLGKQTLLLFVQTLCVCSVWINLHRVSLLSQLCRTALKAPTGTRGTKLCTVKISCDEKSFLFFYFGI